MNVVNKLIKDLKFADYNPRQLSKKQHADLKISLEKFGFVDPIIINKHKGRENVIIGGHQRVKVAKSMGMTEVPCVVFDLPEETERELNVRLNKNTGDWDWDMLGNEFDLEELIDWGFTEDELAGKAIDDAEDGEEIEIPQSVQIEPPKEYILIMAEPNSVEWEQMKELLKLQVVRKGGYKKGSPFDAVGLERVLEWSDFKKRYANSSTK